MEDNARMLAFQEACRDPRRYLEKHFQITKHSCPSHVQIFFRQCAFDTGVSQKDADEAVNAFFKCEIVPGFVTQVVSAQVVRKYQESAVTRSG